MSLCLLSLIPGSLGFASTWRVRFYDYSFMQEQNLLMPLGFYSLGLEMIGLIVLWTEYRKKELWAWFVMLIILLFFIFPSNVLPLLLQVVETPKTWDWSGFFKGILEGYRPGIWMAVGLLDFLVMVFALLLPIKAFFGKRPTAQINGGSANE